MITKIEKKDFNVSQVLLREKLEVQSLLTKKQKISLQSHKVKNQIWYRYRNNEGISFFVSLKEETLSSNLMCINSPIVGELIDFGYWQPPLTSRVWCTEDQIEIILTALSWKKHHQLFSDYYHSFISRQKCHATLKCSYDLAQSALSEALTLDVMNESFTVSVTCNSNFTIRLEEKMDTSIDKQVVHAEFLIGGIALSIADYVSLEPGDTIHIAETGECITGVLCVGGVTIATGRLSLSPSGMRLELDTSEEMTEAGNILSDSSIQHEKGPIQ